MNTELQNKLQAFLDGELPPTEAREIEALLARDAAARALHTELGWMKAALAGGDNEAPRPVPAPRELYWSQIRRQIEREAAAPAPAAAPGLFALLRRYFAPAAGAAFVAVLAVTSLRTGEEYYFETENLSEFTETHSFRAADDKITVVFVHDKEVEEDEEMFLDLDSDAQ